MKSLSLLSVLALSLSACIVRTTAQVNATSSASATRAASGTAATSATVATDAQSGNPFAGATQVTNPDYVAKVESTAKAYPADAEAIRKVEAIPTAVWLDSIASVANVSKILTSSEQQQAAGGKTMFSVFVVYDLPNRDCSAKAAAGELDVAKDGEQRYKAEFIDKIAAEFAAHPTQRIVAILEPDSLPNLATNMNVPKCAASDQVYRRSIAYAISKLKQPNVTLYLDAAHAGWLGWANNSQKIATIFKDVLTQAGGADKVRGFATNVSNYNTVSGKDGKKLGASNPCPDEETYVNQLTKSLTAEGITGKTFIIDTARDGKVVRGSWSSWCNIKGAGLGPRPQASPIPMVDAYLWVKPPGESDGTTDEKSPRFDTGCKSVDSMPNAPEGGQWFAEHFVEMVRNAEPRL
jgi:cellulose 1,4-beta-cellobiosidase